jgi:hypothetical protein
MRLETVRDRRSQDVHGCPYEAQNRGLRSRTSRGREESLVSRTLGGGESFGSGIASLKRCAKRACGVAVYSVMQLCAAARTQDACLWRDGRRQPMLLRMPTPAMRATSSSAVCPLCAR